MVEGMPVFCRVVGIGPELAVISGCDLLRFRPPWSTLTSLSRHQFTFTSSPSSVAGTVDPTYYTAPTSPFAPSTRW
nr:F-box/kelch-repeat protein At1g80440-like [Ipomoea batatas]GME01057.1 F-box/kelch-repeat protein At1g80440-like [Ipomoea batatas]